MGSKPIPVSVPTVVANEADRPRFSAIRAPLVWFNPSPPNSSGMFAAIKPRSAAFLTRSRASCQLCLSSSSTRGVTSLSTKRRVVSAIIRCSSVKSSGVNVSSTAHSLVKNAPPLINCCSAKTAKFVPLWEQPWTDQPEIEKHSECQTGYQASSRNPAMVFRNSSDQPNPGQHHDQQAGKVQQEQRNTGQRREMRFVRMG